MAIKTINKKIITKNFNKKLESKVLFILEKIFNSKFTNWIIFANQFKDFINNNTINIKEKYKISYLVTNIANLIINSNNSKIIYLDKEDQRYFISNISNKYIKNEME